MPIRSLADYRRRVRGLVRGLWSGDLKLFEFVDSFTLAIRRGFTQAWLEGLKAEGIKPEEMSEREAAYLEDRINEELTYIIPFAEHIQANSKANGGKLNAFNYRITLWLSRYGEVKELGRLIAAGDKKKMWRFNPAKEHCVDCQNLDGRVYRASTWAKYDIRPRSPKLACFGGHCGCELVDTDAPLTPGRPPSLKGPRSHDHIHHEHTH